MANFFVTETTVAIIFFLILGIFLWFKRKNLEIQKWIFPLLYLIMYKGNWGIKSMDKIAKKHPKIVKFISYSGVFIGFTGMILISALLLISFFKILGGNTSAVVGVAQPFVKTSIGSPFIYIPFSYFIILIFIIAFVHEFSHGIVARLFKAKIKSSGFAFFSILIPILPAAFVEPDEKQVSKLKPMQQLAIFAAGPLSNILLAALVLLLFLGINPAIANISTQDVVIMNYTPENSTFPAELAGVGLGESIKQIDNINISNTQDFVDFMEKTKPNQTILMYTNESKYDITLIESPNNNETGYLGVIVLQQNDYTQSFKENYRWFIGPLNWLMGFLVLLFLFNLGVGLINLVPCGPLDGGRMVLTVLKIKFKEKKAIAIWGKITLITLLILLADIFLPVILKMFK